LRYRRAGGDSGRRGDRPAGARYGRSRFPPGANRRPTPGGTVSIPHRVCFQTPAIRRPPPAIMGREVQPMTRDGLARPVLLEFGRRERAIADREPPPAWQRWAVRGRDDDVGYGPKYSPKWFGGAGATEARRVRPLRVVHKLGESGLLTLVVSEAGRLQRVRLTEAGRAAVAELRTGRRCGRADSPSPPARHQVHHPAPADVRPRPIAAWSPDFSQSASVIPPAYPPGRRPQPGSGVAAGGPVRRPRPRPPTHPGRTPAPAPA
jgi:hypothetical protein